MLSSSPVTTDRRKCITVDLVMFALNYILQIMRMVGLPQTLIPANKEEYTCDTMYCVCEEALDPYN